jgi:hypothetical protein
MKNLNRKIYSQLGNQLDRLIFWQFERQLRSELGKKIRSPLRRQFYWQINEQIKTQMKDGKSQ